jgi:acyl carrier protein
VSAFTFVRPGARRATPGVLRLRFMDVTAKIRRILKEHGRLNRDAETLAPNEDLYEAGMTSHASVNVMLALEGEFDLEFPDHMLKRSVFDSIASISAAIGELQAAAA